MSILDGLPQKMLPQTRHNTKLIKTAKRRRKEQKMKYLIIQGSSIHKQFVHCKACDKPFVWLRCYRGDDGYYFALCSECKHQTIREHI
jgi:hypothetical protein